MTLKDTIFNGEYNGYAVIGVNLAGLINFDGIQISKSNTYSWSFGSGLILLYAFKYSYTNDTVLTVRNSSFMYNKDNYTTGSNPIEQLENGKRRVSIFGAAGLTLLFIESSLRMTLIENSRITNNTGTLSGGILVCLLNLKHSRVEIEHSSFVNNTLFEKMATESGSAHISIHDNLFYRNANRYIGAGIYAKVTNYIGYKGSFDIKECNFTRNRAFFKGSTIYIEGGSHDSGRKLKVRYPLCLLIYFVGKWKKAL